MPRNSPTGFVCAFFATVMGFALIWHIWWMVAAGALGAFATFVVFAWRDHDEDTSFRPTKSRASTATTWAQRHAGTRRRERRRMSTIALPDVQPRDT